MSPARNRDADLEPGTPEELIRLAERLEHDRPVPSAAFRGALRRRLVAEGTQATRPVGLRRLITSYASGGVFLLLVGVASAGGIGPLGA